MNNEEIKKLCLALAQAESEEEVVRQLKGAGLWNDPTAWRDYGDNPNNYAVIGAQQERADSALAEKIINAVDAMLLRECLRRGIHPESPDAPPSIRAALEEFFGIREGRLSTLDPRTRSQLAQNIMLVATGEKSKPCYTIIDWGEGQTPQRMPETFLSLNKSNKLRVPFVQGKFNMGGTGALRFCSKQHNLQLIISRRDPAIAPWEEDPTQDLWGFTIVRRENPSQGERSSIYRYLAPGGKILCFAADELLLLPGDYPEPYANGLKHGSFVKLYEYQVPNTYRGIINLELYFRLALLLPQIALPITMYERRPGFKGHSYHTVLSGLSVRLEENRNENLEPGFPSSSVEMVRNQRMYVQVYAFKRGKRQNYSRSEGVVFTVNGQAHGFFEQTFFDRKSVGMSYLRDSILVLVDCTDFDRRSQEDLFMNTRDRLSRGELRMAIEEVLEGLLREHPGLRALRERRRREELEQRLAENRPLQEILEKLIKKTPSLAQLFQPGWRLSNPFALEKAVSALQFTGKKFPTYFRLARNFPEEKPKQAHMKSRFRVEFETDAANDYFDREEDPGEFTLWCGDTEIKDFSLSLWNGVATLQAALPEEAQEGQRLHFRSVTTDSSRVEPFVNEFWVQVLGAREEMTGAPGTRRKPPGNKDPQGERQKSAALALPNIVLLRQDDERWSHHFQDKTDALSVRDSGENGYDFYVNADNVFLLNEIKTNPQVDPRLLETRFSHGLVLLALACLKYQQEKKDNASPEDEKAQTEETLWNENSLYNVIFSLSKAVAPVLLPMIAALGDLEIEDAEVFAAEAPTSDEAPAAVSRSAYESPMEAQMRLC